MTDGRVERAEAANAKTNRLLVAVALLAFVVILATGVTTVTLQVREIAKANQDRAELKMIGLELKDCTTPQDTATACQRRLADSQRPVLKALSEDNLRASVAVGTCLREGVQPEGLEACALAKFRAAAARAEAERAAAARTIPP